MTKKIQTGRKRRTESGRKERRLHSCGGRAPCPIARSLAAMGAGAGGRQARQPMHVEAIHQKDVYTASPTAVLGTCGHDASINRHMPENMLIGITKESLTYSC
jgi:hypothetical protein